MANIGEQMLDATLGVLSPPPAVVLLLRSRVAVLRRPTRRRRLINAQAELERTGSNPVAILDPRRFHGVAVHGQVRAGAEASHGHSTLVYKQVSVRLRELRVGEHEVTVAGRADQVYGTLDLTHEAPGSAATDLQPHSWQIGRSFRTGRIATVVPGCWPLHKVLPCGSAGLDDAGRTMLYGADRSQVGRPTVL